MTISEGDKLPEATFRALEPDGIEAKSTDEIFSGKRIVLFAVPGAFTPTCHLEHMPGFVDAAEKLKEKGADQVVCVAVNDPFVLNVWAEATGAKGKVTILSDGNGEFTKKIGMDFDGSAVGLGTRSKRYSMIVDDGIVEAIHTEDSPGVCKVSSAEEILKQL